MNSMLRLPQHARWLSTILLGWIVSLATATEPKALTVAAQLYEIRETVAAELTAMLRTNSLKSSYTTVWRQFEDAAITALCERLPHHLPELRPEHFDAGRGGREKNRLADLAIVCPDGTIEISIKSARAGTNPENDLGTFRDHPNRKQRFVAAFTCWVRYPSAGETITAERVFFDRSWRFVGKSTLVDGVKYRKKDGNLRPKPWAMFDTGEAFWLTEAEFEAAVKRSELFRANELVKEYLAELSESDQRVLYETLRERFAP